MRDAAIASYFRPKSKPRVQPGSAPHRSFPHDSLIQNEGRLSKAI
jgi:hypothetical protein